MYSIPLTLNFYADFCTKYIKQSRNVSQLLATNFAQCLVMLREQKSEQGQCIYHACFEDHA